MAGGQDALLQKAHHLGGQGQEPQGVGDGWPGFAHLLGHLLLGQAVFLHQGLIALGFLHRVQVLPLKVFNEADFHNFFIVRLDDDHGNLTEACVFRGPPAAFSGDDLVVAGGQTADGKGLDDSMDTDGVSQLCQGFRVEALPGLIQTRLHLGDGQGYRPVPLVLNLRGAQQGVEAPA